jgi:hypothetical protein
MWNWQTVVVICAGIITVFNLIEKLWKYTRPVAKADRDIKDAVADVALLKSSFEGLRTRVEQVELHQSSDLKALQDHAKANKVVCNALLALLDHELSGNHTVQLEEAKEKIQSYLIER